MFSRLLGVPILLAAAVGVPYVATNGPNIDGLFKSSPAVEAAPQTPQQDLLAQLPKPKPRPQMPQGPGARLYPTKTPLEGMATLSLQQVFNFNVTKEWVYQQWSRKSTALSDLGLFGIRVPLVTGTQLHDLAGSLTYFFGNDGRVHRISFHGTTGDTTQLVMLVAQQYGLQQQSTPIAGEQLFQIRRQNQIFSELKTRPAPVLWSSSPHDSFSVDLQLQHPGVQTPLPSQSPTMSAVQSPTPQQPAVQAQQVDPPNTGEEVAESAKKKKDVDPKEKWEVFFPRSRVPKKQIDSLDRRGQIW